MHPPGRTALLFLALLFAWPVLSRKVWNPNYARRFVRRHHPITAARGFTVPIKRRPTSRELGKRDGVSGQIGLGDNSDLYADTQLGFHGLTVFQIVYRAH